LFVFNYNDNAERDRNRGYGTRFRHWTYWLQKRAERKPTSSSVTFELALYRPISVMIDVCYSFRRCKCLLSRDHLGSSAGQSSTSTLDHILTFLLLVRFPSLISPPPSPVDVPEPSHPVLSRSSAFEATTAHTPPFLIWSSYLLSDILIVGRPHDCLIPFSLV